MVQLVHKTMRASNKSLGAAVCLLEATVLDKIHLLHCRLIKDLTP